MSNRGIGRARIFLGAILLLAAAMTWIIILMMSPHGPASVHGTQHLRSTIVTLKRNAAIGTLVLCALGGWLEFPRRRPKRPARDISLAALIVFLAGSSLYTLVWNEPSFPSGAKPDGNYAVEGQSADAGDEADLPAVMGPSTASADMNVAPAVLPSFHPSSDVRKARSEDSEKPEERAQAVNNDIDEEQPDAATLTPSNPESNGPSNAPSNDAVDDNQQ